MHLILIMQLITLMKRLVVQQAHLLTLITVAGLLMVIITSSQFAFQLLIQPKFAVLQTYNLP